MVKVRIPRNSRGTFVFALFRNGDETHTSSQRRYINTTDYDLATHRNYAYNRGHEQTNCIYIPTGTQEIPQQPPSPLATNICHDAPSLLLTNVCHVGNKIDELYAAIDNYIDVSIIETESRLSNDISNSSISAGSSTITYRKDPSNCIGSGVVAFMNNRLRTT